MKVVDWAEAVARWIAAGRPTRSEAEVQAIFRTFCSFCYLYDKRHRACRQCGCWVKSEGVAVFNKIAMMTEHCPVEKW